MALGLLTQPHADHCQRVSLRSSPGPPVIRGCIHLCDDAGCVSHSGVRVQCHLKEVPGRQALFVHCALVSDELCVCERAVFAVLGQRRQVVGEVRRLKDSIMGGRGRGFRKPLHIGSGKKFHPATPKALATPYILSSLGCRVCSGDLTMFKNTVGRPSP